MRRLSVAVVVAACMCAAIYMWASGLVIDQNSVGHVMNGPVEESTSRPAVSTNPVLNSGREEVLQTVPSLANAKNVAARAALWFRLVDRDSGNGIAPDGLVACQMLAIGTSAVISETPGTSEGRLRYNDGRRALEVSRFDLDRVMLSVTAEGYVEFRKAMEPLLPGEERDIGDIHLSKESRLKFVLNFEADDPLDCATLRIDHNESHLSRKVVFSKGDNVKIFTGLPAGHYQWEALGRLTDRRLDREIVLAYGESRTLSVRIVPQSKQRTIRGRVLMDGNNPLSGVMVVASTFMDGDSSVCTAGRGAGDQNGEFIIYDEAGQKSPNLRVELVRRVVAGHPVEDYDQSLLVVNTQWGARDADIRLVRRADVGSVVVGIQRSYEVGRLVEGVLVVRKRSGSEWVIVEKNRTVSNNNSVVLERLPVGRYDLRILGSADVAESCVESVDITKGETKMCTLALARRSVASIDVSCRSGVETRCDIMYCIVEGNRTFSSLAIGNKIPIIEQAEFFDKAFTKYHDTCIRVVERTSATVGVGSVPVNMLSASPCENDIIIVKRGERHDVFDICGLLRANGKHVIQLVD